MGVRWSAPTGPAAPVVPRSAPSGWPQQVRPPGSPGWEESAAAFLFDCCPADHRGQAVLRRHPVVLARFAVRHLDAQLSAAADGLGELRLELDRVVPPESVQAAVEAWEEVAALLRRRRREAAMVEAALRGTAFIDTW